MAEQQEGAFYCVTQPQEANLIRCILSRGRIADANPPRRRRPQMPATFFFHFLLGSINRPGSTCSRNGVPNTEPRLSPRWVRFSEAFPDPQPPRARDLRSEVDRLRFAPAELVARALESVAQREKTASFAAPVLQTSADEAEDPDGAGKSPNNSEGFNSAPGGTRTHDPRLLEGRV